MGKPNKRRLRIAEQDGDMDMDKAPSNSSAQKGVKKSDKLRKRRANKNASFVANAMTDDGDSIKDMNPQKHADAFPLIPGVNRHGTMVFASTGAVGKLKKRGSTTTKQKKRKALLAQKAASLVERMSVRKEKEVTTKMQKEHLKHLY